ncbi:hypothetical protein HF289_10975 [Acidithiobacillus ferrooxidans]|jgi:hypothetical protein|uniref:hypothetical protein n=1 Tax=Acidithiobacillus ferrooxidans TaxID=920 RepID=UPI001C0767B0|nr:hypothetical protein [Acidithiobacillus ferrooxidans]MBU2857366.1 hypothetical protein [Acidithiobacillus ferrooxidans]MBU2862069.1 hypothetical protein [Acidithiobacillus ferrooxidans]
MSISNGWTPERRARQAEMIRQWRPWQQSTGPVTEAGKAKSAANAKSLGVRAARREMQAVMALIREYDRQEREMMKLTRP